MTTPQTFRIYKRCLVLPFFPRFLIRSIGMVGGGGGGGVGVDNPAFGGRLTKGLGGGATNAGGGGGGGMLCSFFNRFGTSCSCDDILRFAVSDSLLESVCTMRMSGFGDSVTVFRSAYAVRTTSNAFRNDSACSKLRNDIDFVPAGVACTRYS